MLVLHPYDLLGVSDSIFFVWYPFLGRIRNKSSFSIVCL